MSVSVLVLTRNEERDIAACLETVTWSDDIHVLDSFSADQTVAIANACGATVSRRAFDDWSTHQNWAVRNLPFKYPWVLYIDADERVTAELADSIRSLATATSRFAAFRVRRRDFFSDGTWLKHAQISPFLIRLFRPELIRYERTVNPVAVVTGDVGDAHGFLDHYPFSKGLDHWVNRHLSYASFEAQMNTREPRGSLWKALFNRDFNSRRQNQKRLFMQMPLRPAVKFAYMLFWRRAFLDGRAGLSYSMLQMFYEQLIELKTRDLMSSDGLNR
jgi:glycosyltransferase involved in cell wall biosynthesis